MPPKHEDAVRSRRKTMVTVLGAVWAGAWLAYMGVYVGPSAMPALLPSELAQLVLVVLTPVMLAVVLYNNFNIRHEISVLSEAVNKQDEHDMEPEAPSPEPVPPLTLDDVETAVKEATETATKKIIDAQPKPQDEALAEMTDSLQALRDDLSRIEETLETLLEDEEYEEEPEEEEETVSEDQEEPEEQESEQEETGIEAVEPEPEPDPVVPVPAKASASDWVVLGQSVPKPKNDAFMVAGRQVSRQSEDRFRISELSDGVLAAVADGAGSSGMFCGSWAEALVTQLPEQPFSGFAAFNDWIGDFWQGFYDEQKERARDDQMKLNKFVQEGSCSTLVACWASKTSPETTTLTWVGYGDSPLYVFDKSGGGAELIASYPGNLDQFERDPHLLNWKDLPDENRLTFGSLDIAGPATVVLASDGIGQAVLLRYLADRHDQPSHEKATPLTASLLAEFRNMVDTGHGKLADMARNHASDTDADFPRAMTDLQSHLASAEHFKTLMDDHHARRLIPNDDLTAVVIDL